MNGDPLDELDEQAAEIARLRLTDEEREAIETAAMIYEQGLAQFDNAADGSRAIALRKLLERAR